MQRKSGRLESKRQIEAEAAAKEAFLAAVTQQVFTSHDLVQTILGFLPYGSLFSAVQVQ